MSVDSHPQATGWKRWLTTTNHKDMGTMYLIYAFSMFIVGGVLALIMRLELISPGMRFIQPEFYNQCVTMHGLIMILGAIMPAFSGFINWNVPLMIGASDMAFARINNWAFWLLIPASLLLIGSFFVPGGAPASGWVLIPPLSIQMGIGMDFAIFGVHIMGISSILGAINTIVTILNLRAPGMSLFKMPIFCWTALITSYLVLAIMPVLAAVITMLLFDRHLGTSFFNSSGGGDPLLYQHIFWFFGHPEVYVMALPAFGIISSVIPTFARKPLFGYHSMVWASIAIAAMSLTVWAHHMFTAGMLPSSVLFFMYSTMVIGVPTGIKVFNWLATMLCGSMTFETPMCFAIGFLLLFLIGGLSGIVLASAPLDTQVHNTYYVIAHFHYVLVSGALFSIFSGFYYWFPKWTGKMYHEKLGLLHFWCMFISFNITFFPMHFLGISGMVRHIPDYNPAFTNFNVLASVGAFGFGLSQLILLYNVWYSLRSNTNSPQVPWEGATTIEWTHLPTPAPYHSFSTPPDLRS